MSSITLQDHVVKAVTQYSERKGVSITEAANMLIASGVKRLAAVHRWMDKNKAPAKPRAKKAAKGTTLAKKAKAAKAPKAKAPKARKPKAAPAETAATVQ